MSKVRMVIADSDEDYVEGLTGFLLNNYSQRFHISAFTRMEYLEKYLSDNEDRIDLFLVSPELISVKSLMKSGTVIILYEGKYSGKVEGYECVNKYQHGDVLVASILEILSAEGRPEFAKFSAAKDTRIIAVYSPIGGAGKTSIAANLSIQCSKRGLKTFYLNLENIQAASCYFNGSSEHNLSHVFFYLKDGECDLGMKLEGLKSIDTAYDVHFFMPSESILEMSEMHPGDYRRLIGQFRQTGSYDVVVIDMDTSFDQRNMALLEMSDEVMLVGGEDPISRAKFAAFYKQLEILDNNASFNIYDKIRPVVNKHTGSQTDDGALQVFPGFQISLQLPFVENGGMGQILPGRGDDSFAMALFHWTARYVRS